MREIILHIGMNKTGTTTIQNSLHGIDSHGVRTVRFKEKNHSVPLTTIFSEKRKAVKWKNIGLTNDKIDEKRDEYKKIFEKELSDQSVNLFIVSGEGISGLNESEQQNLCRFLKEKNLSIRIIYVVRDPFSWAVSANQQRAKWGARALSRVNPHYKRRVLGFIKECGIENIYIYKFEDLIQKGLVQSFSEMIGFKLKEGKRENESVTSEALSLLYSLNSITAPTLGSPLYYRAREEIIGALGSFFSRSNGFKKINLEEFDLVAPSAAKDLVWLKENFGITYPSPWGRVIEGSTFEDFPDLEKLFDFFQLYRLAYKSSLPVVENIQNLYMKFLSFAETDSQIDSLLKQEKWFDSLQLITKAIELGDERHSKHRQASNISNRLKKYDDAIAFAKKAVNAKDNSDISLANHKEHLANMLRTAKKQEEALIVIDELLETDENRYSAYEVKANILLDMQKVEEAKAIILRSIELGDERHSAYRQASNISHRLKDSDNAVRFAKQAVNAKDNNVKSQQNHKEHLAKMLQVFGK